TFRIFTECTERSFQTLDVTMVIRPEEVDKSVKAALHLVIMIGDVRHEVSVCTVALAEHAVLVITEICRPEPQGIVLLECIRSEERRVGKERSSRRGRDAERRT